ncbi:hypothetical protein [Haloarcula sp. K1]|nr:hypothetical protein [Haloarcula sp. K1]
MVFGSATILPILVVDIFLLLELDAGFVELICEHADGFVTLRL